MEAETTSEPHGTEEACPAVWLSLILSTARDSGSRRLQSVALHRTYTDHYSQRGFPT